VAKAARNGNDLATDGTVGGNNGNVGCGFGHLDALSTLPCPRLRPREMGGCALLYAVVKVRAAWGGAAVIELNYH